MDRSSTARVLPSVLALTLLPLPLLYAQKSVDSEAIFSVGLTHLRENRPALALEEFKKAVRQDPKSPYFQKGLGLAYARLNRYPDAIAAFHKALELNPYYVDVHNDLGAVLLVSGKRTEGKAEFLAAFNDPTNPSPELSSRNLGQAYFEEKNYAEAANWYRTSLGRNKQNLDAALGLGESLLALGRPEEAVAGLEAAAKDLTGQPALLAVLGEAYYRAGKFAEARTRLEEAVRRDPVGAAGQRAAELIKHLPR